MPSLPEPDIDAVSHSRELQAQIRAEIDNAGGWIPFTRYMELALYAPGLGYYGGGAAKFGASGDFVTAPEISPLFGRALARQAAQIIQLTDGDILELGAGTGRLTADMLIELERLGRLPRNYFVLELGAELKERQRALLTSRTPRLVDRVRWLDRLPESFIGLIFGNEVLDAMPVHVVAWRAHGICERGVRARPDAFAWAERPVEPGGLLEIARALNPPPDYVSEIGLAARGFIKTLAQILDRGALLFVDYGFGQREYYHPQRKTGTLMCHYRHHAHDDPFFWPGLQDITAHVDFTGVAERAIDAGLKLLGFTTQAHFLINCGVAQILEEMPATSAAAYLPLANQLQKLVSPAEMGDLFKAIALGKGIDEPLLGFVRGDKSRLL